MTIEISSLCSRLLNHLTLKINVIFFLTVVPSITCLSFNFDSFTPNDPDITYENAYPANNAIQLTANQRDRSTLASIGRATYSQPLQLWDKSSGKINDFSTHFSFVINSQNRSAYGDGIAFFLAPAGSKIPANATKGGSLGLTNDDRFLNSTDNPFVAVEFDIYQNRWDPEHVHVGININSMKSLVNVTWFSSILDGKKNDAWISYNSSSRNLSIIFTGFRNNDTVLQNLHYIVDLKEHLPDLVTFGFSAATGNASALHTINSWNFSSTLHVNLGPNPSKKNIGLVIGLAVGGSILVGGAGLFLFMFWIKKKRKSEDMDDSIIDITTNDELERGSGPKKFTYSALSRATNNFAQQEKLGEGGFGGVYRGYLKEFKAYVAVKRVSRESKQGSKEYASEVKIISRLRHRNLVQLIGWCHEKKELLLVYEFMPNGSLDSHLFKGKSLLTWNRRYNIAQGLASALLYLHEEWEQCVVHRDIKSSNIMLDSNFSAKLGDFGLARLVDHDKGSQTTILAGTMGYMAPECVITGKASKETDVYSFGVVALEIACGRKPIDLRAEESQVHIVEWVWSLFGTGRLLEAADPKLGSEFNQKEMEHLMIVGLWCAHPDSNLRPSVRQAIRVLDFEAPLPILSPSMPVPTYCTLFPLPKTQPYSKHNDVSENSQIQLSSHSNYTDSSQLSASSETHSASASLLYTR